jgi:hypothetical protein
MVRKGNAKRIYDAQRKRKELSAKRIYGAQRKRKAHL